MGPACDVEYEYCEMTRWPPVYENGKSNTNVMLNGASWPPPGGGSVGMVTTRGVNTVVSCAGGTKFVPGSRGFTVTFAMRTAHVPSDGRANVPAIRPSRR